ncbi:phosphomethylpyrimidine synthase ThiC [bacterium]|nr:phosphomethylpyrimidine synthase ThiC [bacterium]
MERITIGNRLNKKTKIVIGKDLPTKINFIIGTNSKTKISVENEIKKIDLAVKMGVHTITDLSIVRLEKPLWKYVKQKYPHIAVGINPPYLPYVENKGMISPQKLFLEIKNFVLSGGDFMTINFVPKTLSQLKKYLHNRKVPITSRQGGILASYMIKNGTGNPYWVILDDLMNLLKKYHVTVNIGSTFRPAGIAEAYDKAHKWEINRQMEIYQLFEKSGIQSIVEIMSHQPLHQIGSGIIGLRKKYGQYVPFQLLGPIVADIGSGRYDHITAAIGAAEAARYNVGKITVIPPKEHVGMPTLQDVAEGINAAKISVHAGDLTRLPKLINEDWKILLLRSKYRSCNPLAKTKGCNKCGKYCPLILINPNKNES